MKQSKLELLPQGIFEMSEHATRPIIYVVKKKDTNNIVGKFGNKRRAELYANNLIQQTNKFHIVEEEKHNDLS